jgi:hypothetical protein
MAKTQGKEPEDAIWSSYTHQKLSHFKGGKKSFFPSQDNKDPRSWCCIPRPHESNELKIT